MAKKATKKTAKKKSSKTSKSLAGRTVKELRQVSFDYIKSNAFRVIRVDGIHGGVGPKLNSIQMALFSERQAIPQREIYSIKDGKLGDLEKKEGRNAIIREVEVEAIIDIETAMAIRDWLSEKIEIIDKLRSQDK